MKDFDLKNIAPWMTELWLDSIPITKLYTPSMKNYCLCEFAFFLIDDDWNVQSLTNLKHKTGAAFLLGLQTTSKRVDKIDVVDGIIICKPHEVTNVMKVSEVMSNREDSSITMDFDVTRQAIQFTKPAQFIHSTIIGKDRLDRTERAIDQIFDQIPQDISIDVMIISVKTDGNISMEEYSIIEAAIDKRVNGDMSIWYCTTSIIDVPECCWIEAIYMTK